MEYYNQYNLSSELANSITKIINKKENSNYVCTILNCVISEQQEYKIDSKEDFCFGRDKKLSVFQVAAMDEPSYNNNKKAIQQSSIPYLVVMESTTYDVLSKLNFTNIKQIENTLPTFCLVYQEYDGIFDSTIFYQRFPYLKEFFDSLDEWREETGRVTIDDNVLKRELKKSLNQKAV